jgi:hypothetical protein
MNKLLPKHTRIIRWYACGCREIEDNDSIQWEASAGAADPFCGEEGHPHGKLLKEITQQARPVETTVTNWVFDDIPE